LLEDEELLLLLLDELEELLEDAPVLSISTVNVSIIAPDAFVSRTVTVMNSFTTGGIRLRLIAKVR
jgi:hypothetical protein